MEVVKLWGKNSWWAKFLKNWSKKKTKLAPWMEEGTQNLLAKIGSCGMLWIPSTTNVLPLLGGNN
jgi:transposase-like protein